MESGKIEEQNFILEVIDLYRSFPALWNVKDRAYSDRNLKNANYEILLKKYQERYPKARKSDLTSKINNLRSSYRRELKRISTLERSGAGVNEDIEPRLYYFDAMGFLYDCEQPCSSRSSMQKESETEDNETPTKRRKQDATAEFMAVATKRIMEPKDDFKKIAESWAIELKNMNETQRIFAKKFINDILFEGQMGTLHRNAMHLNVNSPASTPQSNFSNTTAENSFVRVPIISPQDTASNLSYIGSNYGRNSVQPTISPQDNIPRSRSGRNSIVNIPTVYPEGIGSSSNSIQSFKVEMPTASPDEYITIRPDAQWNVVGNDMSENRTEEELTDTAAYLATFKSP